MGEIPKKRKRKDKKRKKQRRKMQRKSKEEEVKEEHDSSQYADTIIIDSSEEDNGNVHMKQDLIENNENKLERTAPQGASYLMLWLNEIPQYDF